jgi:hypothetical protein
MPVISFTDRDLLRGQVLPPAWYTVHIETIGEAPSADKQSINYPVEGTILRNGDTGDEAFKGTPLDWNFNSKAIGFAAGFLKALLIEVTSGKRFELAAAAGHDVDVYVENDTWQGRVVNRVNHKYRPVRRTETV